MSEYQYYEFLAIDQPLSAADMRWLRSLSSRAEITSTSFTNTYQWGDFKGDPTKLMMRCFDAHVYDSDLGIRHFAIRLPADAIDRDAPDTYFGEIDGLSVWCDDPLVLAFGIEREPGDTDGGESGTNWMASLAPLRSELLNGDLRSLYLAWLLNVELDALEPNEREPPVPPGLAQLSAACEALGDFLMLDRTLLEVAAERSAPLSEVELSESDWRNHVAGLSASARDELLTHLLMRDDAGLRRKIRRELQLSRPGVRQQSAASARTVGELTSEWNRRKALAGQHAAERAAHARQIEAQEEARLRREYLAKVAAAEAAAWRDVRALIERRTPRDYDRAAQLLTDLRDAASAGLLGGDFVKNLAEVRAAHASKPTLIRRLDTAGLR